MALGSKEVLPGGDPWAPPPPPRRSPIPFTPVCWLLATVSIAVFIGGSLAPRADEWLDLNGPDVRAGEWWRVLSWTVVHGGALHLFFNLMALWSVGRSLEVALRPTRFFLVSAVGALGAAGAVLAFDFDRPTVGLSGVILSWAGCALPLMGRAARQNLALWLGQVAILSLLPGISWAGHLGGFLFGLPFGWALRSGTRRFSNVAPVITFLAALLVLVAGTGRLT